MSTISQSKKQKTKLEKIDIQVLDTMQHKCEIQATLYLQGF